MDRRGEQAELIYRRACVCGAHLRWISGWRRGAAQHPGDYGMWITPAKPERLNSPRPCGRPDTRIKIRRTVVIRRRALLSPVRLAHACERLAGGPLTRACWLLLGIRGIKGALGCGVSIFRVFAQPSCLILKYNISGLTRNPLTKVSACVRARHVAYASRCRGHCFVPWRVIDYLYAWIIMFPRAQIVHGLHVTSQ